MHTDAFAGLIPTFNAAMTDVPSALTRPVSLCWRAVVILAWVLALANSGYSARAQSSSGLAQPSAADSITVERAVEQTLETYPTIDAARRDVDAAAARVEQARSGYWPRVSAVGTYQRQGPVSEITVPGGNQSIGIQPNNLYDSHLEVHQTLYDFGQTASRIDQAAAGQAAAQRRVAIERTELAFQTIQAFYTNLLAQARIDVQRDQIDQFEQTLAVVLKQKEAGTATDFEVQSTRTRISAAQSQLTEFRAQQQREETELRRLLGRDPNIPLSARLSGTLEPTMTPAEASQIRVDSLARHALQHHPSVQVARAQVEASRQQVRVADRSDNPTLSLDAQGGVRNGYAGDLNEPRLNQSVGVSLNVPLFRGFATRREVDEAEANVQAAEARLIDVQRQVSAQVVQAASDLRARLDRLATTQLRVDQAQAAAQLARTRYEAGIITNLELLEAETALQQARLERTEVRYRVVLGRYALQRAVGTLLPLDAASL